MTEVSAAAGTDGRQPTSPAGNREPLIKVDSLVKYYPIHAGFLRRHVGDVRAYRIRQGALSRLTRDHSLVEEMRAARPDISDEDLSKFAHRNVVTRALGSKGEVDPTIHQDNFEQGDIYMLCCDGLWDEVPDSRILEILSSTVDIEQACQALVDAANEAGGRDNITAVVVRVE